MVRCIATFIDACYIARRNAIDSASHEHLQDCVQTYYQLRTIFLDAGIRTTVSILRQHALMHFYHAIRLFGSPNGLCSSITKSKHIQAVKQPWHQSSRYNALAQMLRTLPRMDKMMALYRHFKHCGMLRGFGWETNFDTNVPLDESEEHEDELEDEAVVFGEPKDESKFDVTLTTRSRAFKSFLEDPIIHLSTFQRLVIRLNFKPLQCTSNSPSFHLPSPSSSTKFPTQMNQLPH
jgi:hypothetical protein